MFNIFCEHFWPEQNCMTKLLKKKRKRFINYFIIIKKNVPKFVVGVNQENAENAFVAEQLLKVGQEWSTCLAKRSEKRNFRRVVSLASVSYSA